MYIKAFLYNILTAIFSLHMLDLTLHTSAVVVNGNVFPTHKLYLRRPLKYVWPPIFLICPSLCSHFIKPRPPLVFVAYSMLQCTLGCHIVTPPTLAQSAAATTPASIILWEILHTLL